MTEFKSRYYTITPDQLEESMTVQIIRKQASRRNLFKQPSISDLKIAEDGEIYLSDNNPDFLFEKYDKMRAGIFDDEVKEEKEYEEEDFDAQVARINSMTDIYSIDISERSEQSDNTSIGEKMDKKKKVSVELDDDSVSSMPMMRSMSMCKRASSRRLMQRSNSKVFKKKELSTELDDDSNRGSSSRRLMKKSSSKMLKKHSTRQLGKKDSSKRLKFREDEEEEETKDTDCPMFNLLNLDPANAKVKVDEEKFLALIEADKKLCSKKYYFDALGKDKVHPLHMLCALGASYPTVKKCYKAYAEAIDFPSKQKGNTVLHYAVMYTRAPLKVIQFLVTKEPDAITAVNNKKRTPLHVACMCSPKFKLHNPEVIMLLTEIEPVCTKKLDLKGHSPLHHACKVDKPSLAVVEDLTEVGPQACVLQTEDTRSTPLHLALANEHVSKEEKGLVQIVKDLLRSNAAATKLKNADGDLPIFVAVKNRACLKVLKVLVKKYPDCLECTNKKGKTPLEVAQALKLSDEIIDFLDPYE